eukprot:SAG22_NODE_2468_length_2538_cov_15.117261_1_plen_347_part_10
MAAEGPVVPKQLNYAQGVLPVAIESRSNKRTFEPINGNTFAPGNNAICRLNINSDNLCDFTHSYLQAVLTNTSTKALALDTGIPWINRVQILSGGQELESISEYSRLHSMIEAIQGNPNQSGELSLTQNARFPMSDNTSIASASVSITGTDGSLTKQQVQDAVASGVGQGLARVVDRHGKVTDPNAIAAGASYTFNFSLISAILNQPKYFPLIFTNLGLDIYIHLETPENIGVWSDTPDQGGYSISNVQYHCHLVDVDKSFYDRMRQSMMASGGVLQFSGTTYKHYLDSHANGGDTHNVQISTRVKSLNALFVRPQRQNLNNNKDTFCISQGESCGMDSYVFRIGSM